MPLTLFFFLFLSQSFGSDLIEICPKSIESTVECSNPGSRPGFQLVKHTAHYKLNVKKSQELLQMYQEANIRKCSYEPAPMPSNDTGWTSTYQFEGVRYADINNIDVIHALTSKNIPLKELPQRDYLTSTPFLELHFKTDTPQVTLDAQILFTGFEYMMTRADMMGLHSSDEQEILGVIQKNFSNTSYSEKDYFITGAQCSVIINPS